MAHNEEHAQADASSLQQRVADTTSKLADRAEQTAEELKSAAIERAQQVRESAQSGVEQRREELAGKLRRISGALRQGGETLRENDAFAAHCADVVTDRFDRAADYVAHSDLRTLVRDTERFAREKPVVFFGGAFLLGLAAGRFLKSSGAEQEWPKADTGLRPTLGER